MISRKQQKEFEERETKKQEVELTVVILFGSNSYDQLFNC